MKNNYFSTFLAGGGEFIERWLEEDVDARIINILDGLVEYKAPVPPEVIKRLKYLNNSYWLLAVFEAPDFRNFADKAIRWIKLNGDRVWERLRQAVEGSLTYRLMWYDRNQPAGIDKGLLEAAEKWISGGKLVNRTSPKMEISGIYRSEGAGYLGIRLTRRPDYKNVVQPGELHPEIAYILARLSRLEPGQKILDPFPGSGAIAAAALEFEKNLIFYCGDAEEEKIRRLKKRFGKEKLIYIRRADAADMDWIDSDSIDAIVTDPPWGQFDRKADIANLYIKMCTEFLRVLKPKGRLVILTAAREEFENALNKSGGFLSDMRRDVLISGRKASIYTAVKQG